MLSLGLRPLSGRGTCTPVRLKSRCPHPVLVSNKFIASLKEFDIALSVALTNIVQSWVVDDEADFIADAPREARGENS